MSGIISETIAELNLIWVLLVFAEVYAICATAYRYILA